MEAATMEGIKMALNEMKAMQGTATVVQALDEYSDLMAEFANEAPYHEASAACRVIDRVVLLLKEIRDFVDGLGGDAGIEE